MVYVPSKFGHGDGLSRLIPKYKEPLEDTVIVSLQSEGEFFKKLPFAIQLGNFQWHLN